MAKEKTAEIKLQIPAGAANPAPPIGPALGQHGVNIMEFCKQFNAATQKNAGDIVPVVISVYKDRSFTFITKKPPVGNLIKKEAGIKSGSKVPNRDKVANLTQAQVRKIAEFKLDELNTSDVEAAMRIVAGQCRSMGVTVSE